MVINRFIARDPTRLQTYLAMLRQLVETSKLPREVFERLSESSFSLWERKEAFDPYRLLLQPKSKRQVMLDQILENYRTELQTRLPKESHRDQCLGIIQSSFEMILDI